MFYTYILKSEKNGSYYVGSCSNLSKRLELHNKGLVRSTKRYCPWEIVYSEVHHNLTESRKRELEIKSWRKRKAIENLFRIPKFFNEDPR